MNQAKGHVRIRRYLLKTGLLQSGLTGAPQTWATNPGAKRDRRKPIETGEHMLWPTNTQNKSNETGENS